MPVFKRPKQLPLPTFAVVGDYQNQGNKAGPVKHVGLLPADMIVDVAEETNVFHSGPPLAVGQDTGTGPMLGEMSCHLVGHVSDLSEEERYGMNVWMERIRSTTPVVQSRGAYYCALPADRAILDPTTGAVIGRRFSCVGLVARCYAEGADISLIDELQLPRVTKETIKSVWNAGPLAMASVGVMGDGPWQILLPGYLFHSLERSDARVPFVPSEEHASY